MKWGTILLGDVMDVKHGFAFKSQFFADSGPYVLLSPGNCHESGGLKLKGDKEKYYTGGFPDEYLLHAGDILVVMTDLINRAPILGGSFVIPEDNRYLHNQRLGLVVVRDERRIDQSFLYYLLNTEAYRGQVRGSASGATVRHTSPDRIKRCEVRIPSDVSYQSRIASVLFAYDDLIENNTRRIALMEQAARLLYEEWFVRLRFPGREHTRIVDGVPKGWERKTLGGLCVAVREQVSPTDVDPDTPYIGLEHIPRRSITLSSWGTAADVSSSKHRYRAGEILFGKIRPYFHKIGIALTDGITSSDTIVIRPNGEHLHPLVLMVTSSDHFVKYTSQTVREGSKMPRADWKVMQQYGILFPPSALLDTFSAFVDPILEQLKVLTLQNRQARQARDILLPRLMSGEVAA